MEYSDNRGRKVVFVGHCVLNQNARAPGVAVTRGAFTDFVQILLRNGVGIEQLPCPECLVWGGIARRSLYGWQPLVYNAVQKRWFPILESFIKVSTFLTHGRASKREAHRAVDWMQDHVKQGFEVVGVVTADDSPTCGVTKTEDLLDVIRRGRASGMTLDDFENPRLDKFGPFHQSMLIKGSGIFAGGIMKEIARRQLDIKVVGWDPWTEQKLEAIRIARLLDLEI